MYEFEMKNYKLQIPDFISNFKHLISGEISLSKKLIIYFQVVIIKNKIIFITLY